MSKLSKQLASLEQRDFEQWLIVVVTGILVSAGMVAFVIPGAIQRGGPVHFEVSVSRELFVGLVALLVLFNTYIISNRLNLRRARREVLSTAIQGELLRLQSFSDPLTEVYNRRSLDDMLTKYSRRAERLNKPLSFLMIDVDHFHQINSKFGHTTGDFVLLEVANILKSAVRGSDAVVRYGGDEFLVILADALRKDVEIVCSRIDRLVQEWNHGDHLKDFQLVLSVGASAWEQGKTVDEIIDEADGEMFAAKAHGKSIRATASR